ncbi:hypothetical protein GPN2_13040 [Streptomyces murinus]
MRSTYRRTDRREETVMTQGPLIVGIGGKEPRVDAEAFVAPTASVIGDVTLGAGARSGTARWCAGTSRRSPWGRGRMCRTT